MSNKKNTQTGLVTTSGKSYMDKIQAEFNNLKVIQETPYKTGGAFEAFGKTVNIKTETDPQQLRMLAASVIARTNALKLGDKALGLTDQNYTIDNNTVDNIMLDIQLRLNVLSTESRRRELEAILEEAKEFITVEDKRAMFEEKLAKFGIEL